MKLFPFRYLIVVLLSISMNAQEKLTYQKYPSITNKPFSIADAWCFREETVKQTIRKTAEFQLNKYGDNIPLKNWLVGTFYSSFVAAYKETGENWYLDQAYNWGKKSEWDIHKAINADDVCPAQTYLDLYFIKKEPEIYKQLDKKLSIYFDRNEILPLEKNKYQKNAIPLDGRNTWSWCDALYMAPPVYARMGQVTGDKRYHEMLHRLYWDAVDFLYSPKHQLFYRNSKVVTEKLRTPNGKQVFWSRGNGWVIGGLARLIEYLPNSDPIKKKYIDLFQTLAYSLTKYQMEDGLWRSCVNDPEWYRTKETTGSAFFVYAMAKGVNEGWLPKEYFLPAILKGWSGLMSCVSPEGKLGYSQIVAGQPNSVRPHDSKDYGVGAFILAGTEMLRLQAENEFKALSEETFLPRFVAKDAAWIKNNDDRVIFDNNIFFANYLKSNGNTAVTAYSTEKSSSFYARNEKVLSTMSQKRNYDNGVILPLKKNELLATYSQGEHKNLFLRKIKTSRWSDYKLLKETKLEGASNNNEISNHSICKLSSEKNRIYNFYIENNMSLRYTFSDDEATTWSKPIVVVTSHKKRAKISFSKLVSDSKERIDLVYSNGNETYHIYYFKGAFYTSKGYKIRTLEKLNNKPIKINEGSLVVGADKENTYHINDVEYDQNGRPLVAFVKTTTGVKKTNSYGTAVFTGKKWKSKEIAFTGSSISDEESVGGITIHPNKSNVVVISTNVHPEKDKKLPNEKYQLFTGTKKGEAWQWKQLTFDPVFDHLSPTIVRGEKNALFWFTGDYHSFNNHQTDIMMSYEF